MRSMTVVSADNSDMLPEPLTGSTRIEALTRKDIPSSEALAEHLQKWGLDTSKWGQGDTKDVAMYYKEIKGDEAGLELWRHTDGTVQPVRVTHVLRAKVASPESYRRNVFLFNTWQQFGDGRKRTRNGLLSEKLSLAEMPFEEHIHEVCVRAVTEEEMQRVVEAAFKIGPGTPAPDYDPSIGCPITVVKEHFVDHTIEIEKSKSYPGLLTMYHLYTVDIICTGMPPIDFNTFEFDHPDAKGERKLKYIHAWVWLEWSQIQRYLFEGSELKESKTKGSFASPAALTRWLNQFDLDLKEWGQGKNRSVRDLFVEMETEQAQLELWGRQDGVPMLMRVVHVLQLQVISSDLRLAGKFLLQKWQQSSEGQVQSTNRLLAKKLSTAQLPFDEPRFGDAARAAVGEQLRYLTDPYFQLDGEEAVSEDKQEASSVAVQKVEFVGHRHEVEESPSFKNMHTMYHLYTMEVVCDGLPLADFNSMCFTSSKSKEAGQPVINGWHWSHWQETLDVLHARMSTLERRDAWRLRKVVQASSLISGLGASLDRLVSKTSPDDPDIAQMKQLMAQLQKEVADVRTSQSSGPGGDSGDLARMFPPSMISKMAAQTITSEKFLEQADRKVQRRTSNLTIDRRALDGPFVEDTQDPSSGAREPGCLRRLWCGLNSPS
mmetsp:Transcript_52771/g.139285  ORF Transcript_52771/g.139285 Transcript_52771/m.139285 type:complete len:659 (-) Transcript_52771:154-2130(-)